jgi:hypothetical protein
MAPVTFLRPGFWEAYFEADAATRREFSDTLTRSLQTE